MRYLIRDVKGVFKNHLFLKKKGVFKNLCAEEKMNHCTLESGTYEFRKV